MRLKCPGVGTTEWSIEAASNSFWNREHVAGHAGVCLQKDPSSLVMKMMSCFHYERCQGLYEED